mmetsp:Transcript_87032/g.145214  ORF Transcript_87032/g.145214 Transcript_87032/m.145214 type:complete len:204 (+) Transcript_87032:1063-1674(+)
MRAHSCGLFATKHGPHGPGPRDGGKGLPPEDGPVHPGHALKALLGEAASGLHDGVQQPSHGQVVVPHGAAAPQVRVPRAAGLVHERRGVGARDVLRHPIQKQFGGVGRQVRCFGRAHQQLQKVLHRGQGLQQHRGDGGAVLRGGHGLEGGPQVAGPAVFVGVRKIVRGPDEQHKLVIGALSRNADAMRRRKRILTEAELLLTV